MNDLVMTVRVVAVLMAGGALLGVFYCAVVTFGTVLAHQGCI